MAAYVTNIEQRSLDNENFREVVFTAGNMQLVLMALGPGEDIGLETHDDIDQFIRVEAGTGKAILDDVQYQLEDGTSVVIPAGTKHNVLNTSQSEPLKLYTLYSPPEHPHGTVHISKAEAEEYEQAHHH